MTTQAFNFIGPQPTAQPSQGPLAQMALALGGTAAVPAVQGNEVLANALDQLQKSGAETSKTPLALGANLLADLLLTTSRNRNNAALLKQVQSGQQGMLNGPALPGQSDYDAALASGAAPQATQDGAQPAASQAGPPQTGFGGPGFASPFDAASLAAALAPDSSPPPGAQDHPLAAALNPRAALTPDQVTSLQRDPGAFLGIPGATITSGARSPQHNAAVGGVPTSEHIPGNGYAYDFVPPKGMTNDQAVAQIAASGIPYDQLIGEGNHIHIGWRPEGVQGRGQVRGAPLTGAAPAAGGAPPQAAPTSAEPPQPPPSQWPSSPAPQSASGPPPAGAQPAGGHGQGGGITAQPYPVQPSQFAELEALKAAAQRFPPGSAQWQTYAQKYLAKRDELTEQASNPEPLEIGRANDAGQVPVLGKLSGRFYGWQTAPGAIVAAGPKMRDDGAGGFAQVQGTGWREVQSDAANATKLVNDATGEVKYVENPAYAKPPQGGHFVAGPNGPQVAPTPGEGWVTVQGGPPNATKQVNPVTGEIRYVANPAYGSPPPNTAIDGQGRSAPLPQAPAASATDPKALIPPALLPAYNDAVKQFHEDGAYKDYQNSVNAANALEGVLKNSAGPNGVVAQAALDNTIRSMTGLSARVGSVNSLLEHLPLGEQLKGKLDQMFGTMAISPTVIGQMRDVIRGYAMGHEIAAQQAYDNYNGGAHRQGFDLGLTLPQMSPRGNYSWAGDPAAGGGNAAKYGSDPIAYARSIIARGASRAAVIKQMQADGLSTEGL